MNDAEIEFRAQVERLRQWAEAMEREHGWLCGEGEWETGYHDWAAVHSAWKKLLATQPPARWSDTLCADALHALARDDEGGSMKYALAESGGDAVALLAALAIVDALSPAKTSLIEMLGLLCGDLEFYAAKTDPVAFRAIAEPLLIRFTADDDEYVVTRALSELARLRSPHLEPLALAAWARAVALIDEPDDSQGRHFHMQAILWMLRELGSPHFARLMEQVLASSNDRLRMLGVAETVSG